MCGRYTILFTWKRLHELLDIPLPGPGDMKPSWNVAPTQPVPVCRLNARGLREIVTMRWGFTPNWSRCGKAGPINARSETAASSPMFRHAMAQARCLVPASGFYEWKAAPSGKQPMYIRAVNDELMLFAGLWTPDAGGAESAGTFAVLTTTPNELIAGIHNRMPVIVRSTDAEAWLSSADPPQEVMRPYPAERMQAFPVSTRVNSPKNNDASLCAPAEPERGLFG